MDQSMNPKQINVQHLQMAENYLSLHVPDTFPESSTLQIRAVSSLDNDGIFDIYNSLAVTDKRIDCFLYRLCSDTVSAALLAAITGKQVTVNAALEKSPADILESANRQVTRSGNFQGLSIHAIYISLDILNNKLTFCNTGHEHGIVFSEDGSLKIMEPNSPPLFSSDSSVYVDETLAIKSGDRIVLFF
jgi:serine phosphatase RsbU (regulator of sigma subunit)